MARIDCMIKGGANFVKLPVTLRCSNMGTFAEPAFGFQQNGSYDNL